MVYLKKSKKLLECRGYCYRNLESVLTVDFMHIKLWVLKYFDEINAYTVLIYIHKCFGNILLYISFISIFV